jgi:hypothetical protein
MLLGIRVTLGCTKLVLLISKWINGQLTCVCTKVWTDDCKVDNRIDPTNDKKAHSDPKKPQGLDGQPESQRVEEIHERKLDEVERSPSERGEHESPLRNVQDCRDILSERDHHLLVHGLNEIESVQKLVNAGERDNKTDTRDQDEAIVPLDFSTAEDANREAC